MALLFHLALNALWQFNSSRQWHWHKNPVAPCLVAYLRQQGLTAFLRAKKCDAIAGITEEGEGAIKDTEGCTATRDVGLLPAGQKVERYETLAYGGSVQPDPIPGKEDAAGLLETTLTEVREADRLPDQVQRALIKYFNYRKTADMQSFGSVSV